MALAFKDFISKEISLLPHYLVIGHPINHSLSPLMHQTALDYHNLKAHYYAVELLSDDISDFVSWVNSDSFLGCNITLPYKQLLMDIVDELDPFAESVSAINTIAKEGNKLVGYNTDMHGFLHPLKHHRDELEGATAIIFGTGGASKAVKSGLIAVGIHKIIFVTRSMGKKENEQIDEGVEIQYVDYSQWPAFIEDVRIVVNATPMGMNPYRDQSPVKKSESGLLKDKICYDLVYNPLDTTFLKNAREAGGQSIHGLHMLIHQGNRAFKIWTGKTFPLELIYKKLENYLMS
tara:strand:+ start:21239 stop:22111 length:873 start_codon:yes stop_codon:yes gene_type:complete